MYKKKAAKDKLPINLPCDKHAERQMCAYCMTCDDPICLRCLFENHRLHDCVELELAAKAKREVGLCVCMCACVYLSACLRVCVCVCVCVPLRNCHVKI